MSKVFSPTPQWREHGEIRFRKAIQNDQFQAAITTHGPPDGMEIATAKIIPASVLVAMDQGCNATLQIKLKICWFSRCFFTSL